MTLETIRERAFRLLSENVDAPVYWSAAELTRLINDTYRQIARDTGCLEEISTVTVTAGTQTYEAPETMRWPPMRAAYDGRRLTVATKWEMDRDEDNWESKRGWVSHYVTTMERNREFRLYKAPDATLEQYDFAGQYGLVEVVSGATMTGEYGLVVAWTDDGVSATISGEYGVVVGTYGGDSGLVLHAKRIPPLLVDETDVPEFPEWSQMALAFGAAARALMKHGEQRNVGLAKLYDVAGNEYVTALKALVNSRVPGREFSMSTVRRRRTQRPWPEDPLIEV